MSILYRLKKFADDTKLYREISSTNHYVMFISFDIINLYLKIDMNNYLVIKLH